MLYQLEQKSTHLVFDGEKVIVSPDIMLVFSFLMEIEKDVYSMLNFQKRIKKIEKKNSELLELVKFLMEKIKESNIHFTYSSNKLTEVLKEENQEYNLPVRSQMIVLFAALEVLYFLNIAYDKEIDEEKEMINNAKNNKNIKEFINSFILNNKNEYYKKNEKRFKKINSKSLRNLRNSLTHFFSLSNEGGLGIVPKELIKKSIKLENLAKINKHGNIIFLSPDNLYELIKSANLLRFKRWSDDFINDKEVFKRKMNFVINLVKKYGAVIIQEKNLKI